MLCPTLFIQKNVLYAFGNTTPVSLTQDLPPEQDADILFLGCGDVRNVLFTCFADAARKIDVTCCDIEPLVQARNVLIYSLLMEDTENLNIELIWNIYYHWKIENESLKLLETQCRKLLQMSKTIDQWHDSVYGSTIRFCDEKSLSYIRSYWIGFTSQGLNTSQKANRLKQMQAAINRAKAWYNKSFIKGGVYYSGIESTFPITSQGMKNVDNIRENWWEFGTFPPSKPSPYLNPALLWSPNPALTMNCSIHPLHSIPTCTAYTPITKESPCYVERENILSIEYVVNCARNIFKQWASAFRRAVANKTVIRIFCGDALAMCFTLRNFQLTQTRSMNLYRDNWSTSPVELHHSNYGNNENAAPLFFDIVDTSNLLDSIGPLNLIPLTSSLLKYQASSCLYTETLILRDSSVLERLNGLFGVDVRTLSLLLGLVEPDLFTNATESFEEDLLLNALIKNDGPFGFERSRLRWRRLGGNDESCNFPYIQVEAEKLAKFLIAVHKTMFRYEDPVLIVLESYTKLSLTHYTRASFASLLSFLKATVVTDWNQCIAKIYKSVLSFKLNSYTIAYKEDLFLNMHLFGVDNSSLKKPTPRDVKNAILASVLPCMEDLPNQLCVTIRVPRAKLGIYARRTPQELGVSAVYCSFVGRDPGRGWESFFSTTRMTFGSLLHEQSKTNISYPYIEEDCRQQSGNSDMFISVMVPSKMLLQSKEVVPSVKCGLIPTPHTMRTFASEFDDDLCFAHYTMTSKNIFVSRHMPGMSALPSFPLVNAQEDNPTPALVSVELMNDGLKIDKLIQRVFFESKTVKDKLALESFKVEVKFKSPFTAVIRIGQSETREVKFAVPVSPSKYQMKIIKNSSCIEIKASLFDPFIEDMGSFIFPTFIMKVPGATVPTLWTSTRIDLDAMPSIDLMDKHAASWLIAHTDLMFSEREFNYRVGNMTISDPKVALKAHIRTDLKDSLFSIMMHFAGLLVQKANLFALTKTDDAIQTLIFPSCFRLDLVNHTVVLDTALIPLTKTLLSDPRAVRFIEELKSHDLCQIKVSESENHAWKTIMPALVERCRTAATWYHASSCEYSQAGEVPLFKGVLLDGVSSICSCGVGKFPSGDYLHCQRQNVLDLDYVVDRYATRAALAPIFVVPYVENFKFQHITEYYKREGHSDSAGAMLRNQGIKRAIYNDEKCVLKEKCFKCHRGEQRLLLCSKCRLVRYCSPKCQKTDWQIHKLFCVANLKIKLRSGDVSSILSFVFG